MKFDDLVPTALLLQEGGEVDARMLRAQTELFFKNEIFKVCRLWGENNFAAALEQIQHIHFSVETNILCVSHLTVKLAVESNVCLSRDMLCNNKMSSLMCYRESLFANFTWPL